jgi:D-alanyl-D-alanine carboxypeptidase/D-alanyl-D-alanine-endopeptidase (penicillin-binding protein 4)
MTVQVPALYAAHAFREALERAGIVVSGQPGVVEDRSRSLLGRGGLFGAGSGPRVLARHTSEPLGAYLAVINQESHNLFADLVLKTLGRMVVGEGSYDAGAGVVQRFLTDEVGIAPGTVTMLDGSGLASGNRATPEAFVALLGYMSGRDDWPIYWSTLPEAGTRKLRRMQRTAAALNLRAKTGTIDGVSALSGIVRTARGERVAFSIVGNDLPSAWAAKRLEDRIGARLAELDRGPSTDLGADPATARARDARQP